jgi:hypothetical protein
MAVNVREREWTTITISTNCLSLPREIPGSGLDISST